MLFIVDGHNLVPNIPGLSLSQTDDEERLAGLLQEFCRLSRHRVEVFFDRAAPGRAGARSFGTVQAHFIQPGKTADEAILQRLRRVGKQARGLTVVSSDRRVQAEARALGAALLGSAEFAGRLVQTLQNAPPSATPPPALSPAEVDEWMALFGAGSRPASGRISHDPQ